jgi:S-adenosylmethionine:tRNA ribosyltransferase-isomerase
MPLFFEYELPQHLIAQEPAAKRDASRLLAISGDHGTISHKHFRDLPTLLKPHDLLVLNDTKVIPARLLGTRANTGGKWEGLFLRTLDDGTWELLTQTRGYAKEGETFVVREIFQPSPLEGEGGAQHRVRGSEKPIHPSPRPEAGRPSPSRGEGEKNALCLELVGRTHDRHWLMRPNLPGTPEEILSQFGSIPLPPYIRKGHADAGDRERYQTVYADRSGSVAAPTAGLHFTPELLNKLQSLGIATARVTLHVGLGTFAPVKEADPTKHAIHAEWCEVPETTVNAIRECKKAGGRVIAVGTTSARTLESAARSGELIPYRGETNLFIHPPYPFRVVDGLITNFHLPRTTLLLLVQAFSGSELLKRAYAEAVKKEYRFFSYGDAMVIL